MIYDMTHDIDDGVSQSINHNSEQEHADSTVAHKDNADASGAILYDDCQQHIDGYDNENGVSDGGMEELSDIRTNVKEEAVDIDEHHPKKNNDIIILVQPNNL